MLDRSDRLALALIVVLGIATHFIGLTHPREVVFDEVLMGKHVSSYCCTGQHTFDVHPPHGKELIAIGAWIGGADGKFSFDHIGLQYENQPVFFFRLVPALFGVAIAPLFFLLLRFLGGSYAVALLGG